MVPSHTLENTAVDPRSLKKRQPSDADAPAAPDAATELAALKKRIEAARAVEPDRAEAHCLDCYIKGRDLALRVIDGE
jgi:hypothetical protein